MNKTELVEAMAKEGRPFHGVIFFVIAAVSSCLIISSVVAVIQIGLNGADVVDVGIIDFISA